MSIFKDQPKKLYVRVFNAWQHPDGSKEIALSFGRGRQVDQVVEFKINPRGRVVKQ